MIVKKIPGTMGFFASTCGQIFDSKMVAKNTYFNGDGYVTVNVKLEDRRWITFGVHRLVALAFIEQTDLDRTQVNHRDLDITNNCVGNLEWVTPYLNNLHAEISRFDSRYPSVYSVLNGKPHELYNSAHEAEAKTGVRWLDVWDSIKDGKIFNGYRFFHKGHKSSLPEGLSFDRTVNFKDDSTRKPKPIKLMDIDTGEVIFYPSFLDASKELRVSPSHIHQSIPRDGHPRVLLKRYQVAYAQDDFLPLSREEFIRAKQHGAKKVIAYNSESCKYTVFKSAKEFIAYIRHSKKAVTVALKKDRIREFGKWVALYESPKNILKLKTYVESPVTT